MSQFNNNWLIGDYGGLSFNSDTITVFSHPHSLYYHTPILSDCNGILNLYRNDNFIYNRNHNKISNIQLGNSTGIDGMSIIPIPSKNNEFYTIFNKNAGNPELVYHKINMNLNNGLGEFTTINSKNIYYFKNADQKSVTIAKHANGIDYWLIIRPHYHITYPYSSDTLYSFLIDSSGINNIPIKSKLNSIQTSDTTGNLHVPLIMSNNEKQIAISNNLFRNANPNNITLYTYDFDNKTGVFSNEKIKLSQNNHLYSYVLGIEFSPNDSFIYVQTLEIPYSPYPPRLLSPEILLQIDNNSNNYLTNSKLIYRNRDKSNVDIRIASNNQIIVSNHTDKYLSIIEFPNKPFPFCNFKKSVLKYTNNNLTFGHLPAKFTDLKFLNFDAKETEQGNCTDTTELSLELDSSFIQVSIYFGDGDSLILNNNDIKTTKKIKHFYQSNGTYLCKLKALVNSCGYHLWNSHSLYIKKKPKLFKGLPVLKSYCDSVVFILNDSIQYVNNYSVYWGDNDTLNANSNQYKSPLLASHKYTQTGRYLLQYELSNIEGCRLVFSDTISINLLPKPKLNYYIQGQQSYNNKTYQGCEPLTLHFIDSTLNITSGKIQWNNQFDMYSNYQLLSQTFNAGNYTAIVNDSNAYGCFSTDTFNVVAWNKPNLEIEHYPISNCLKDNQFKFINKSINNINDNVQFDIYWSMSDSINMIDSFSKRFQDTGLKSIKYLAKSKYGCKTIEDTFVHVYPFVSARFLVNKDTQCYNGNEFNLQLNNKEDVHCTWNMGNDSVILANGLYSVNFRYKSMGEYAIRNITKTSNQCKDTFIKNIVVLESPKAGMTIKDSAMCFNGNEFVINVITSPNNGVSQNIHWGDTININGISNGELKHRYKSSGSKNILLIADLNSCKDSMNKIVNIHPHPDLNIIETGYCNGDVIDFKFNNLNSLIIKNSLWKINSVFISDKDSFNYTFRNSGTYKINLTVKSEFDCISNIEKNIEIIEKPTANFDFTQLGRNINGIEIYYYNKSLNSDHWLWLMDNNDTFHRKNLNYTYNDTGYRYTTLISSNKGVCFDTVILKIPVLDKIIFYFPNAFSPDNNLTNDGFGINPNQFDLVKEYQLSVYNRWGELVYQTNSVTTQWKPISQLGVYIYTAKIRDVYNVFHDVKGVVELIR